MKGRVSETVGRKKQQPDKRIVSKDEYLARFAKREAKRWSSVAMAIAVAGCFVCALGFSFSIFFAESILWKGVDGLIAIGAFVAGGALMKQAEKNMQEALVKLDVVPLTRANAGDLRAPEILVRASQRPDQASQTELLRAAQHSAETAPEELLRASITDEQK